MRRGTLNFTAEPYVQSVDGVLRIEAGGATPGTGFGTVTTDSAKLNGTLQIAARDGYVPAVADRLPIVDVADRNGTFATVLGTAAGPGRRWSVHYDADGVALIAEAAEMAAPTPADPAAAPISPTIKAAAPSALAAAPVDDRYRVAAGAVLHVGARARTPGQRSSRGRRTDPHRLAQPRSERGARRSPHRRTLVPRLQARYRAPSLPTPVPRRPAFARGQRRDPPGIREDPGSVEHRFRPSASITLSASRAVA